MKALCSWLVGMVGGWAMAQGTGTSLQLQDGSSFSSSSPTGLFPYLLDEVSSDGNSAAMARVQGEVVPGEFVLMKLSAYDRDNPAAYLSGGRTTATMNDSLSLGLASGGSGDQLGLRIRLHGSLKVPAGSGWNGAQPFGMVRLSATYLSGGPTSYRTMVAELYLHGGVGPSAGQLHLPDPDFGASPENENLFLLPENSPPPVTLQNGYYVWSIDRAISVPLIDALNPDLPVTDNPLTLTLQAKGFIGAPESWVTIGGQPPECLADFENSASFALDGFGPVVLDTGGPGAPVYEPLPEGAVYRMGAHSTLVTAPPPPPLRIRSIEPVGESMRIVIESLDGARYAIERATGLDNFDPETATTVNGLEGETPMLVPKPSPSRGFYRLRYD